jgi:iron-sulfur cluster assembly protein
MAVQIEVTKEAQSQVRELIKSQKPGTAVRVFLQAGGGGGCGSGGGCGGGCSCGSGASSGPSFGMAFDRPRNGDEVVQSDGFKVVVDSSAAELLNGAKIDFVQELNASGFKIVPPMSLDMGASPSGSAEAGGGCGCGSGGCGCG